MSMHEPLHRQNHLGETRHFGFELELSGIDIPTLSKLIQSLYGGHIRQEKPLLHHVEQTKLGDFTVEMDSNSVKKVVHELKDNAALPNPVADLMQATSNLITDNAGEIIPNEIVTAPLTFKQAKQLELLRERLYEMNAQGTYGGMFKAFGMQINPEIYSDEANETRDLLRAFIVLYPWLKDRANIDMTRRVTGFADPFPQPYIALLFADDYAPEWDTLIADYLTHNPTRNRALDLLPLFAHMRPDSLSALDEDMRRLVKARPAYHYRLPNCEIDDPNWRIARDWNDWLEVERLANDKTKLIRLCSDYLAFLNRPLNISQREWRIRMEQEMNSE